ncbi:hypothetical protein V2S85_04045 [Novosphingobium resinovorum]|nr:hypothetical protein [Novosphingobium resinovorum]
MEWRAGIDALYIAPRSCLLMGITIDATPMGPVIRADAGKMTDVPGVHAAGDIARAAVSAGP